MTTSRASAATSTALIDGLPTDFEAVRNPLTGDLAAAYLRLRAAIACPARWARCVRRRSAARGRGQLFAQDRPHECRPGAGYDRRKFIAAPGTVLAALTA
jgi:hypothetical protein